MPPSSSPANGVLPLAHTANQEITKPILCPRSPAPPPTPATTMLVFNCRPHTLVHVVPSRHPPHASIKHTRVHTHTHGDQITMESKVVLLRAPAETSRDKIKLSFNFAAPTCTDRSPEVVQKFVPPSKTPAKWVSIRRRRERIGGHPSPSGKTPQREN